jgi:4'-phosphopantetheinyl transferase
VPPAPDHDEVQVLLVRPDEALARLSVSLWLMLDREERDRARSYPAGSRAEWFVAVHGLLRSALGEAVGAPPKSLRLSRGPSGKPFLATPAGAKLCFSLSHTPTLGAIAIARGREVGIDIEELRAIDGAVELARRHLPPRDVEALSGVPAGHLGREFLRLWTRNESRLKARGDGLSGATPAADGPAPGDDAPARWDTLDLALGREHVGAVTVEGHARVRIVTWRAAVAAAGPGQFTFTRTELTANAT